LPHGQRLRSGTVGGETAARTLKGQNLPPSGFGVVALAVVHPTDTRATRGVTKRDRGAATVGAHGQRIVIAKPSRGLAASLDVVLGVKMFPRALCLETNSSLFAVVKPDSHSSSIICGCCRCRTCLVQYCPPTRRTRTQLPRRAQQLHVMLCPHALPVLRARPPTSAPFWDC